MLLWPFNKYPGTDYETFNWEWILHTVKTYTQKVDDFIEYITGTWNDFRNDITDTWNDFKDWTTGEIDQMHDDFAEYVNVTEGALNTGAIADGAITKPKINNDFLEEIENGYITPEMFGAVGDGVTDDTSAFRDMADSNIATVLLRNKYLITTRVDLTDKNIYGSNNNVIHVKSGTIRDTVIKFISCNLYGVNFESTFDQESTWLDNTTAGYSNSMITFAGDSLLSNCTVKNIEILSFSGDSATINGLNAIDCTQVIGAHDLTSLIIQNCNFNTQNADSLAHAIYVAANVDFVEIAECNFIDCESYPIHVYNSNPGNNCKKALIHDCYIDTTAQGIATNADNTIIENVIIDEVTLTPIYIGGTAPNVTIKNSTIKNLVETFIGFQSGVTPKIKMIGNILKCQKLFGTRNCDLEFINNVIEAESVGSFMSIANDMNVVIKGNHFKATRYTSAFIVSDSTTAETSCIITDNTIETNSTTLTYSRDGVDVYYLTNNTMIGTSNNIAYGYTPGRAHNNNAI